MIAKPSPWDSEVFGCEVGVLQLGEIPPSKSAILEANIGKFDVVFVKVEGVQFVEGVSAIDHVYEMSCHEFPDMWQRVADAVQVYDPRPEHVAISRTAFKTSRFFRDPRISRRTSELYEKWLSGNGTIYALKDAPDDAFMVMSTDPDGSGRISLLAVSENCRGRGVGSRLTLSVIAQLSDTIEWRVKVSSSNVRALRFYEHLGFRVSSASTAFHVWTKE